MDHPPDAKWGISPAESVQEAMPLAPLSWNRGVGYEFKNHVISVRLRASENSPRVVRDAELVPISDAGKQINLEFLLWRIGSGIWDHVHREGGPSIRHESFLSRKHDGSEIGVLGRLVTRKVRSIPNSCYVLRDIQLRPEDNIICSVAPIVYGSHLIVGENHSVLIYRDRKSVV